MHVLVTQAQTRVAQAVGGSHNSLKVCKCFKGNGEAGVRPRCTISRNTYPMHAYLYRPFPQGMLPEEAVASAGQRLTVASAGQRSAVASSDREMSASGGHTEPPGS